MGNSVHDGFVQGPARSDGSDRRTRLLTQICGYAAAIVLPWFGATLSIRSHALQTTPVALNFVAMAGITILTGLGPGLVALASTALIFNYYVMSNGAWSASPKNLLRTAAILCIGSLIVWLCERQRVIRKKLRVTLSSLQMRTDFLTKAQQASNSVAWMFNTQDSHIPGQKVGQKSLDLRSRRFQPPGHPFCWSWKKIATGLSRPSNRRFELERLFKSSSACAGPTAMFTGWKAGERALHRTRISGAASQSTLPIARTQSLPWFVLRSWRPSGVSPPPLPMRSTILWKQSRICFIWPPAIRNSSRRPGATWKLPIRSCAIG